ncbi:hypothetical protein ACI8AA_01270 [Geodermatophilus sp. SYSU D01180]
MQVRQQQVNTKYGLLTIHLIEVDQGWVAKVDSRHEAVPVHQVTDGPIAGSADQALNRLLLAVERS